MRAVNNLNQVGKITCLSRENNLSLKLWGACPLAHKSLWCRLLEEEVVNLMSAVFISCTAAGHCWRKGTDLKGHIILVWLLLCACVCIVWAAVAFDKSCLFLLCVIMSFEREIHQPLQLWEVFPSTCFSYGQHLGSNNI